MQNIENLVDKLEYEKNHLNNLNQKYKLELGGLLKRTLYREERYVLRKKKLKRRINRQKRNIKKLEDVMSSKFCMSFKEGMKFLATAISIVEEENYVFKEIRIGDIYLQPYAVAIPSIQPLPLENTVGVIARKELVDEINNDYNNDILSVERKLKQDYEKHIIAFKEKNLELFDGKKVSKNLSLYFPYLEQICTDIISMRIEFSELSDEEIFSVYLQELQKYVGSDKKQKTKRSY